MKHIIVMWFFIFNPFFCFAQEFESKEDELLFLEGYAAKSIAEINRKPVIKFKDYLRLMPNLNYSRNYNDFQFDEPSDSFSIGISTSQIFSINETAEAKKKTKMQAVRMVNSYKFKIQKLIERKYLFKKKIWQYEQIRKSTTNPVSRAEIDEKIDAATISLQDVLITIESYYAEIDVVVTGV